MNINYLAGKATKPQPSLHGNLIRFRPILAVRISGPSGSWLLDGLLDSGSDDTIFPEWVAAMIGADLESALEMDLHLAGRGKPIRCRYCEVRLKLTDGISESFDWKAIVGFVSVPLKCPLLGQRDSCNFSTSRCTVRISLQR